MSEKMKMPRKGAAEEAPHAETAEAFEPPAAEQDILEKLHAHSERDKLEKPEVQIPQEDLGKLHQDIERCECYPMFKQYVAGELPTLENMFKNVKTLVAEMDAEIETERARVAKGDDSELLRQLEKGRGLLLGRETQIRGCIQRYVNSVIRFNRLRKLSLGGGRDLSKQYEAADHARRRSHNDLLSSLGTYTRAVEELWEEGAADEKIFPHFKFSTWRTGENANERGAGDRTVIFDHAALKNREFIRDWAIVADFHEQLRELGDNDWLQNQNGDHES